VSAMPELNRHNCQTLGFAATLFKTAKSIFVRAYDLKLIPTFRRDIITIEDQAIETLCGTGNKNATDYILKYYFNEITIDDLLENLTFPKEGDRRE